MVTENRWRILFALALASVFPIRSSAQAISTARPEGAIVIDLEVDHANVRDALKLLFQQAKVSYFISPNVTSEPFSAGLHGVPFRAALDFLLEVPEFELTYTMEHGIYTVKRFEVVSQTAPQTMTKTSLIHTSGSDVDTLIKFLQTRNNHISENRLLFSSYPGSSDLFVGYPDTAQGEAEFREVQLMVHFLDRSTHAVEMEVRVECAFTGDSVHRPYQDLLLSQVARVTNVHPLHVSIVSSGVHNVSSRIAVDACSLAADIKPIINHDDSLTLDASGAVSLSLRLPGEQRIGIYNLPYPMPASITLVTRLC